MQMSHDVTRLHSAGDDRSAPEWAGGFELSDLERWEYPEHDGLGDHDVVSAPSDLEELRHLVAAELDADPDELAADDNLISWGMDSIRVMALANQFRRAGIEIKFAELIELPTLTGWWTLLSSRATAVSPHRPAAAADSPVRFPLTPVQHAYWVGRSDGLVLGGVGCHFYVEFDGAAVTSGRLERAVRALSARHPLLRACFNDDGMQEILPNSPWPGLTVHDLRELPGEAVQRHLFELRERAIWLGNVRSETCADPLYTRLGAASSPR